MNRKTNSVSFRASPVLQRRIDDLAEARGGNRSKAIQAALVEATKPKGASAIPSEQEVLSLLRGAARAGNVAAMRELRVYHRERTGKTENPFAEFDELAKRRTARGWTPN